MRVCKCKYQKFEGPLQARDFIGRLLICVEEILRAESQKLKVDIVFMTESEKGYIFSKGVSI